MSWQKPTDPNGIILGYVVTWKMVSNDRGEKVEGNLKQLTTEANVTWSVIEDLGECVIYRVSGIQIKRRVLFELFGKVREIIVLCFINIQLK